jgi:hypothetical protein
MWIMDSGTRPYSHLGEADLTAAQSMHKSMSAGRGTLVIYLPPEADHADAMAAGLVELPREEYLRRVQIARMRAFAKACSA